MKRILFSTIAAIVCMGFLSIGRHDGSVHAGAPAYAICSTASIVNDCCFKFFSVLEGDALVASQKERESMAVSAFRRCLRKDIGCSSEMTELKSRNVPQIRSICR